ncbi:MAG TPA: helix-hairpin-helix domain-containing protein [Vulgatibacter sp.]
MAAIAVCASALPAFAAGKPKGTLTGGVNLNTASAEQLALLPGIGPAVAKRIVEAREQKPFERSWEVTRVKGIGSKLFRKIEDRLRVDGPSDLRVIEPPKASRRASNRRRGPKIVVFARPKAEPPVVGPPLSAAGGSALASHAGSK